MQSPSWSEPCNRRDSPAMMQLVRLKRDSGGRVVVFSATGYTGANASEQRRLALSDSHQASSSQNERCSVRLFRSHTYKKDVG